MASITINTTAAQDAAAQRFIGEYNDRQRALNPNWQNVTAVQYLRNYVNDRLDTIVSEYDQRDNLTRSELFKKSSADDKNTIDAILDKYR